MRTTVAAGSWFRGSTTPSTPMEATTRSTGSIQIMIRWKKRCTSRVDSTDHLRTPNTPPIPTTTLRTRRTFESEYIPNLDSEGESEDYDFDGSYDPDVEDREEGYQSSSEYGF